MVESVYLSLENLKRLEEIKELLPKLKIFSSIFLISNDLPSEFFKVYFIVREISSFLKSYGFCRINLNLVHPFSPGLKEHYLRLIEMVKQFNMEGYVHQGKPRLILLSLLIVDKRSPELEWLLEFFRQNFIIPGIYTRKPFLDKVERLIVQPSCAKEIIDALGCYHIFNDLLDKIEYSEGDITEGCAPSLIIARDGKFPCFGSYWFGQKSCPQCKYHVLRCLKGHPLSKQADMGGLHARMAFEHLKKNEHLYALRHLKEALYLFPKEERANLYLHIGLCQTNLGEYDGAIKSFKKSGEGSACFYLGLCYLKKGDYKKAAGYFRKALKLNATKEDRGYILFYLGLCYKSFGDYGRAIQFLSRAKRLISSGQINNLLGVCYFKLGDYQNALRSFRDAISINPLSAIDYANICVCLKEMGRWGEAIQYCEKSLELDPSIDFAKKTLEELKGKAIDN